MNRIPARVVTLLVVLLLATVVAACGGSSGAPAVRKVDAAKAVGMLGSRVVVDVRTPSEYAAGHIAGARNIDVEAGDFAANISSLDKKASYLVYCRSGRRSALAADQMAAAGFTDIVDGGAMADLVAAGAPTE
jgi:phage shock protein E